MEVASYGSFLPPHAQQRQQSSEAEAELITHLYKHQSSHKELAIVAHPIPIQPTTVSMHAGDGEALGAQQSPPSELRSRLVGPLSLSGDMVPTTTI